jgi:hypothetical protein
MSEMLLLLAGLIIGGLIIYLFMSKKGGSKQVSQVQSTTILEKVEKVFKIVLVEGYFSEIYDYKHTGKFLYFFNTSKKALLIVNAKVMVGYDFRKVLMDIDEKTREVKIVSFPEPEILSVDPDVKYYNVEDNVLNKFSTADLTHIQQEAKSIILERVKDSELPMIARNQIRNLLLEMSELKGWNLVGVDKMLASYQPKID